MLSTEVRELMVKAYEKSHNATEAARNFSVTLCQVPHILYTLIFLCQSTLFFYILF